MNGDTEPNQEFWDGAKFFVIPAGLVMTLLLLHLGYGLATCFFAGLPTGVLIGSAFYQFLADKSPSQNKRHVCTIAASTVSGLAFSLYFLAEGKQLKAAFWAIVPFCFNWPLLFQLWNRKQASGEP